MLLIGLKLCLGFSSLIRNSTLSRKSYRNTRLCRSLFGWCVSVVNVSPVYECVLTRGWGSRDPHYLMFKEKGSTRHSYPGISQQGRGAGGGSDEIRCP